MVYFKSDRENDLLITIIYNTCLTPKGFCVQDPFLNETLDHWFPDNFLINFSITGVNFLFVF